LNVFLYKGFIAYNPRSLHKTNRRDLIPRLAESTPILCCCLTETRRTNSLVLGNAGTVAIRRETMLNLVIFYVCKKRCRKLFSVISIHFFVHFMPVFLGDTHPKIDKYTQALLVKVEQINRLYLKKIFQFFTKLNQERDNIGLFYIGRGFGRETSA